MADTNATYTRSVVCDLPDYASQTITFTLLSFFAAAGTESFPKKIYTLTLDASGTGTQVLPVPDNTGTASWKWEVKLPDEEPYIATLAYNASSIQLTTWLASAVSTETPNSLADSFVNVDGDTMTGDLDMGGNSITNIDVLSYDTTPATALASEGETGWNSTDHTLDIKPDDANVTLQVGRELHVRVYNNSGAQIDNGSVVYSSGAEATEDRLTIALAQANAASTARVLGVATANIANASYGYVTQFGDINGIDLSAFSNGDLVWLSTTVAGGLQNTAPESPDISVFIGVVIDNGESGRLFITTLGNTGTVAAGNATQLTVTARKGSAGTITKGQAVYISGFNLGQAVVEVELADADSASTMPSLGIANESITNAANAEVIIAGRVANIATNAWSVNDSLYVSGTPGTLTNVKPTGTALIQKVANVLRSNASNGVIEVVGAGRTNDVPNVVTHDMSMGGNELQNYAEEPATSSGTSYAVDFNVNGLHEFTMTGNTTITFSNVAAGKSVSLALIQGGTGSYTVSSWPTIDWFPSDTEPTLGATTVAKYDLFTFTVRADGSTVIGTHVGANE